MTQNNRLLKLEMLNEGDSSKAGSQPTIPFYPKRPDSPNASTCAAVSAKPPTFRNLPHRIARII